MGFGKKKTPKHKGYVEQKDTPWITRNRELNTLAYGELPSMYENINVFDDATRAGLDARNDAIYNRAQSDFERMYNQTMGNTLARDYNRFGTTGATPSLYARDLYNLQQQRELADLAYNKAMNYENMINQELNRRYNTLGAYSNLFNATGQTAQAFDDRNWQIKNINRNIDYQNELNKYNASRSGLSAFLNPIGNLIGGGAISGDTSGSGGFDLGQLFNIATALFGKGSSLTGGDSGSSTGTLIGEAINNVAKGDGKGKQSDLEQAISGTVSGATTGSAFGPWGTAIGAALGLGSSFFDDIF